MSETGAVSARRTDEVDRPETERFEGLVTSKGETTITPEVVAKVARKAASEIDGVELVSGGGIRGLLSMARAAPPGASADVASRQTALDLNVSVVWPRPVRSVTDQVRAAVRSKVEELTGYEVTDVDINVESLPAPSRPRNRVS